MNRETHPDPIPASLHDVAAVLIVRHLDRHRPATVVRCLFDSYERIADRHQRVDQRMRAAERLAERRLTAASSGGGVTIPLPAPRYAPAAWRDSQTSIAP